MKHEGYCFIVVGQNLRRFAAACQHCLLKTGKIDNSEMNDLYPEDSALEALNVPPFIYFFD